jgi:DNA replication protein DnaC
MGPADPIGAGRLTLAPNDLRPPAIELVWPDPAARADKEGWPAARSLAALAEHEVAERANRRIQRHLGEARLPPGKTLGAFDSEAVPMLSEAQAMALAAGDSWLEKGADPLAFGPPPGAGESHLAAALGLALVENGWRVLSTRTTELVQRLQTARRDLRLEAAIAKLDKCHLLILDGIAYVTKDQAETSAIFEPIAARSERRSLTITADQPSGEWHRIFPDQAMAALAAVDRPVHHAATFGMDVESYRRRAAIGRRRGPGRPPTRATINTSSWSSRRPGNRLPPCRAATIIQVAPRQSSSRRDHRLSP